MIRGDSMGYIRIPQGEYDKALFQLRSQLNAIWSHTKCHGLQLDFDPALQESVKVCELFAMRIRGKDTPIMVRKEPRRRATE